MNNRYVQIVGLGLGLAILIYLLLWMITAIFRLPVAAEVRGLIAGLLAVWIVWKFYAWRIG